MQHHLLEALNNSIRQTHTASDYQGTFRLPQNSRDLDLYIPSNRLHLLSDISKTLYWINDINAELYNQNNVPVIANNHQLHSLKDTMSHHIPEVIFDFSLTVKAAPHECVIRTGRPQTQVKAENEACFYSKVTVSSCAITSLRFSS